MAEFEYPYQLVAFLSNEPKLGEHVYGGKNGWYPQIALKRRFKKVGISEEQLIESISVYFSNFGSFTIKTGGLVKPERMPVKVVEVAFSKDLMGFHTGLIEYLDTSIESRYPEREGANYLPHITAEQHDGKMAIIPEEFIDKEFVIDTVWLLKDIESEDSVAYRKFKT